MTDASTPEERLAYRRLVAQRADVALRAEQDALRERFGDANEHLLVLWLERLWREAGWLQRWSTPPTGLPLEQHHPWRITLWEHICGLLDDIQYGSRADGENP